MSAATGKYGPIEVFKAGSFTDMGGTTQTITEADLREIAGTYDANLAPAPVVIGHPKTDAPAFGWVETLYVEGGVLKATLKDTVSEFADMVKAGRYKRVSISLFLPKSSANPKPGNMYIRHVGFLGAAAPAVPGLKPVKFAGEWSDSLIIHQDEPAPTFADGDELRRLRLAVREQEVERLISEGRVLPLFKDEVVAFAASLDDNETVSFSEGRAETRKGWFMSYLAKQPKLVSYGAIDLGQDLLRAMPTRQAGNIPDGYKVDQSNSDTLFAAQELVREKGVSFADAVDMVIAGAR